VVMDGSWLMGNLKVACILPRIRATRNLEVAKPAPAAGPSGSSPAKGTLIRR